MVGDNNEQCDTAVSDASKCGDTASLPSGNKCGGADIGFYKSAGGNGLFIESTANPVLPIAIFSRLFRSLVDELLAARSARINRYLSWVYLHQPRWVSVYGDNGFPSPLPGTNACNLGTVF